MSKEDIIRVLRLVEYVGPRGAVEEQVRKSLHGTREFGSHNSFVPMRITAITIGEFGEVISDEVAKKLYPGE